MNLRSKVTVRVSGSYETKEWWHARLTTNLSL